MNKLNLGCGTDIREGYINLDYLNGEGVNVVHNLDEFPYPFDDNQFDEVLMLSVFEHLTNTPEVIKELHRITKPRGDITIEVPHFSSFWSWTDITHKRPYSYFSLENYNIEHSDCNIKKMSLEVKENLKFIVNKKINVSMIYKIFGMGWFANKFPYIYERFLAYTFPAGNVIFKLRPIKLDSEKNNKA